MMMSKIRISTGIVLFLFVLGHLLNLAFGLVSLEAMEAARPILMGLWSNPVGGTVLLASFLIHAVLGLWTLYHRNTLFMNWRDSGQALLGLAILPLLLPHVLGTAVAPALTGSTITFQWVLAVYWLYAPGLGMQQVIALIVIWVHGCAGLFLWLHVQRWWVRLAPFTYPLLVAVPVAALLGFVAAGKFLYENRDDQALMAPVRETSALYDTVAAQLWNIHDTILLAYLAIVALVLFARWLRVRGQASLVDLTYSDVSVGIISQPAGLSLLEMAGTSQLNHASLCGGRGRCGSCSVWVIEGADNLAGQGTQEAETLKRLAAPGDIRLACQAKPRQGCVKVARCYPPLIMPGEYQKLLDHPDKGRLPPPATEVAPMPEIADGDALPAPSVEAV